MPNYVFVMRVSINDVADVKDLIVVTTDTLDDAVRSARAHTMFWWGVPTGESVDTLEWKYDHSSPESLILADPVYKGEFSNFDLGVLRRAVEVQKFDTLDDEKIIALIEEQQDNGMPRPSTAMLLALFGPEFAARCAVQLED